MSLPDDIIQQLSCWLSDHSDLVTETPFKTFTGGVGRLHLCGGRLNSTSLPRVYAGVASGDVVFGGGLTGVAAAAVVEVPTPVL